MWVRACGVLGLAAALGCSKGSLQRDAGPSNGGGVLGGTGSGASTGSTGSGAGTGTGAGGGLVGGTGSGGAWGADAGDRDAPPQLIGLRSFVVTSTLTQQPDAGTSPLPIFNEHRFTMIVDWTRRMVITGANGAGNGVPITPSADGGTIELPVIFSVTSNSGVSYEHLEFAVAPDGTLSGSAAGWGFYQPDVTTLSDRVPVTASLTGLPDAESPTLTANVGAAPIDPFDTVKVSASEPLPPGLWLTFADPQGGWVDLPPTYVASYAGFVYSPMPPKMWRYSTRYSLVLEGVVDFAGNAATAASAISFTTGPPPPLAPEDGFESATGTTFGGAQVLSGASAPTISGARSLYIPPSPEMQPPGRADITQLAIRLTLAPTDTVVRFSYRAVNPGPYYLSSSDPIYLLGAPGSEFKSAQIETYTASPSSAMIPGVGEVLLGPLKKAELPLPASAITAGEVTLARRLTKCCGGLVVPALAGLILDDLRAE